MSNATIRVSFGAGTPLDAVAHLSAEIDARTDGLNAGKTNFVAGESVYILVYRSANVSIDTLETSAGSLVYHSQISVTKSAELLFENAATASLETPAQSITSTSWIGRSLGDLTLQGDKTTVQAAQSGVAVAAVSYSAQADVYRLTSPATINGQTDFSILAVIIGNVTES